MCFIRKLSGDLKLLFFDDFMLSVFLLLLNIIILFFIGICFMWVLEFEKKVVDRGVLV